MKHFKLTDWIFCGMIAVGAAGDILLPSMGSLVIADEICGCMMLLGVALWLLRFALKALKVKQTKVMLVAGVLALVFGLIAVSGVVNVAADLGEGPRTMTLSSCEVERDSGFRGFLFQDFYLTGVDSQGREHRLVISRDAYYDLENNKSVTVEVYEHSGRVVTLK